MDDYQRPLFLKENDSEQKTRGSEETARSTTGNLVREMIRRCQERFTTPPKKKKRQKLFLPKKSNTPFKTRTLYHLETTEQPGSSQPVQKMPEEQRPHIPEKQLLQEKANTDALKVPEKIVASGSLKFAMEKRLKEFEQSILKMNGDYQDGELKRGSANLLHEDPKQEAAKHELTKESYKMIVTFPEDLMNFIKSKGLIVRYQTCFKKFNCPVSLELGSDLVLSSESSDALHEALAAVQDNISVETIILRGAAALPPELDRVKETLINASNEANQSGLRAYVMFFPGLEGNMVTEVRLVGFKDTVNKLKEILQDHQMKSLTTQVTLTLPHPELVDHFDKFMGLIGMTETQVIFKAVHFHAPCVVLSGLRYKVQEAKQALSTALARVIVDSLVLDGPGALLYYQTDGEVSKGLIESSCKVFITARKDVQQLKANSSFLQCFANGYAPLNLNQNQAVFGSDPSGLQEVSVSLTDEVKLQLVFGDIANETTDVVVNSTNFKDFHGGVCNAILSVAGRHLETSLRQAKVNPGAVFITPPGWFPCKSIFHVHGRKKTQIIEQLVYGIIQQCESLQYKSVAIPAICAGAGGLDSQVVADTILQAIKNANSSTRFHHLSNIRLVLIEVGLFLTFKQQLERMFPPNVFKTESFLQCGKQPLDLIPGFLSTISPGEQSVFFFLGLCRKEVDEAKTRVNDLYQAHCSTKTFPKEDLVDLTEADVKALQELLKTEALHAQEDSPGSGGLKVSGLKVGVNKVAQMLHTTAPLRREMKIKEVEEKLNALVTWCILGHDGKWVRLPKAARNDLEKGDVAKGIVDQRAKRWSVDLQRMEAQSIGQTTKLKRLENRADFTLPLDWDNMGPEENLKVVLLQADSTEYQTVQDSFKQTAANTVLKIERVQNVHLRRTYEVQKQHISEKNKAQGAGEKFLYHGTSQETCDSIQKNGFNRSFSGKNGTVLGYGTYFAVAANYSIKYTRPAADGSRTMFVARVLTGSYTRGNSSMKLPPPRSSQEPNDRYDTVVDRTNNPTMFVVFNDNQAYPDYLITFY